MAVTVYQGVWNCEPCGLKNISPDLLDCPNCDDPFSPSIHKTERFRLLPGAKVIVNPGKDPGPLWECGKCHVANRWAMDVCRKCKRKRSGDDILVAKRIIVSGVDAKGVKLNTVEDAENAWADAVLTAADPLSEVEDKPVEIQTMTYGPQGDPFDAYPIGSTSGIFDGDVPSWVPDMLHKVTSRVKPRVVAIVAAVVIMLGIGVVGVRALYVNVFATETVNLTVKVLTWERSIEVEAYKTLTEEGWVVPSGGRITSQRTEVKEYVKEFSHYETRYRTVTERLRTGSHRESYACGSTTRDMGNGRFEVEPTYCYQDVDDYTYVDRIEPYQEPVYRDVPVYGTWYTYQIDRWVTDRWVPASGNTNPEWPEPKLNGPKERIGDDRHEEYRVVLMDVQGREFDRKVGLDIWNRLSIGEVVQAEQNKQGWVPKVHWPPS